MSNYPYNPLRAVWPAGADPEAWAFATGDHWEIGETPVEAPAFARRLAGIVRAALVDVLGPDVPAVVEITLVDGGIQVRAGILEQQGRAIDPDDAEIIADLLDDFEAEARWIAAARKGQP